MVKTMEDYNVPRAIRPVEPKETTTAMNAVKCFSYECRLPALLWRI
jgi:hypothetical protein